MIAHNVYFWLKDEENLEQFTAGLDSLKSISLAKGVQWGVPAKMAARPVLDSSYSYHLTMTFDTMADHDAYQVHDTHTSFISANKEKWEKVIVLDSEI